MAVQATLNSRQGKTTEVFSIRQQVRLFQVSGFCLLKCVLIPRFLQLKDEAEKLLSFQTLGTRMSQLDNIIKRRVSNFNVHLNRWLVSCS